MPVAPKHVRVLLPHNTQPDKDVRKSIQPLHKMSVQEVRSKLEPRFPAIARIPSLATHHHLFEIDSLHDVNLSCFIPARIL